MLDIIAIPSPRQISADQHAPISRGRKHGATGGSPGPREAVLLWLATQSSPPQRGYACLSPCSSARELILGVNFALSAAKAQKRQSARETRRELKAVAAGWRERRENDLKEKGVVIPLSDWLGHNQGPPILEPTLLLERQWRAAQTAAFAPPDPETGRRWVKMAADRGLSCREYRLELLERGRHPTEEEAQCIIKARPASAGPTDV